MLKEMSKLRIIGPKSVLAPVLDRLYDMKILHVVEKGVQGLEQGKPFASADQLSAALVKARAAAAQLGIPEASALSKKPNHRMLAEIDALAQKLQGLEKKAKEASEQVATAGRQAEKLEALHRLKIEPRQLRPYSSLEWFIGTVSNSALLKEQLEKITSRFLLHAEKDGRKDTIALFADRAHAMEIKALLVKQDFASLDAGEVAELTLPDAKKALTQAHAAKKSVAEERESLKKSYAFSLPVAIQSLHEELAKAEAPLRFQETEQLFLIHGFVPKAELPSAMEALKKASKDRLHFEVLDIDHHDIVPVQLQNPKAVKSFEFFLNLYTLPKYREIDPTWFLFITFPILYGFMLGDMGYGAVTLLLFFLLKKKMPQFSGFFNILMFSSIATMFFGAIFGEYFGFELYHPLVNRNPEHDLNPLVIAAVFAGIVHINAGLVTGFINEMRSHGIKTAIFAKGGWFVLEAGVVVLGLSMAGIALPGAAGKLAAMAIILVAAVMLYKGEGIIGVVEIPALFSNILSYLRLMAIGLSSVGLALVINDLSSQLFASGGAMIAVAILILAVGHVLNIAIGIMGSFLHALRLHYVELFSKFYKGGGITFNPFGAK